MFEKKNPRTVKKGISKNAGFSNDLPGTLPSPLLQKIRTHDKVSVVTANDNLEICSYQCALKTQERSAHVCRSASHM